MAGSKRRREEPTPSVPPGEWTPLAAPYVAPNGLTVETVGDVARLAEIGAFFEAKWRFDGYRDSQAVLATRGISHVFVTLRDGVMQSYGELVVRDGEIVDEYGFGHARGLDVAQASPRARSAVAAFVKVANAGLVPLAYDVADDGFEARPALPEAWVPLADPWTAPNGLVVEPLGDVASIRAAGERFGTDWADGRVAGGIALRVAGGSCHPYRVLRDGIPCSYGDVSVVGGKAVTFHDGPADAWAAVSAFRRALDAGDVAVAYDMAGLGFVERRPAPAP